jgi:hypothetical protein
MAVKLGNTTASLYLGSTPVAAYLGAEQVYSAVSVPGAPRDVASIFGFLFFNAPASDGGSPITAYKIYRVSDNADITSAFTRLTGGPFTLGEAQYDEKWQVVNPMSQAVFIVAVNAVGEGPGSEPGFADFDDV